MSSETAQIVLAAITAVAAIVWLGGLQFLLASARLGTKNEDRDSADPEMVEEPLTPCISGSAEVEGQAGALAAKAASVVAQNKLFPFGPFKIVEKSESRLRFEQSGRGVGERTAGWFRRGQLRFIPLGPGRTRVEWTVALAPRSWLLWLGGGFQVAGLIALVAGGWAIYTFFASSADPALRWQTLQMLQVSHLLWPPFLFGALNRQGRRMIAAGFEALANNLPYLQD
jgi:hypothetical protein